VRAALGLFLLQLTACNPGLHERLDVQARLLADRALVQILTRTSGALRARCAGAVIAARGDLTWVLTAAHCTAGSEPLFVGRLGSVEPSKPAKVQRVYRHPGFRTHSQMPRHDLAVLRLRGVTERSVLQPAAPRALTGTRPFIVTARDGAIRWVDSEIVSSRPLSLSLRFAQRHVCQGDSGAPVVVQQGHGLRIAGVVSYGPRQCADVATATVLSVARDDFIAAAIDDRTIRNAPRTCAECQEDESARDGACDTIEKRCTAEPACATYLQGLRDCNDAKDVDDCMARRARAASPVTPVGSLRRCFCSSRCSASCAAFCRKVGDLSL
jgi:hypothetical protein